MPSAKAFVPHNRKRQLSKAEPETDFSPQPTAKRQKLEDHQRHRTPSSFWDNLSRQWLTRRTLREFDRRIVWPAIPVSPHRNNKEIINLAKLKRFARYGGPSLNDIRGYPDLEISVSSNSAMDLSQSGSRKRAKTGRESGIFSSIRKTSAYDPAFGQHLIDHGIYPEGYNADEGSQEPANIEDIHRRLAQPRPSLSPSRFDRKKFVEFKQKNREALTENTVMSKAFPIIAGTANIPSQENLYFGNLKDLTDGSITKAKPDFYDGARPTELNKQVREQLSEYIEPSTKKNAPLLANFFTEAKGPDGRAPVNELQAMYDGALGARGIHELRSYVGQETLFDNNAYTITSTYHHSGLLTIYTTHPTPSEDPTNSTEDPTKPTEDPTNSVEDPTNPTEYHMTQLRSFAMTDAPDTFRQGAGALRNARDWTEEKRKELITAANDKAPNVSSPTNTTEYRMTQINGWHMTGNPDTFRQGAGALRNARDWAKEKREELIAAANDEALDLRQSDTFASSSRVIRIDPPPNVLSPTNPTEYRITKLNAFAMTGNPDTFRQGTSALRNARDWAKEKREELIAAANGKVPDTEHSDMVSTQSFVSLLSNEVTHPESETSADELALDVDTNTNCHKTLIRAETNTLLKASPNRQLKKKKEEAHGIGLTITNPLVLYRALLATKKIDPDPAQHRLALHLQKLYYRLKDYQPEVDFSHRLNQINQLVRKPAIDSAEAEDGKKQKNGRRLGILSLLREQKEEADATALTKRLTNHESAVQLQSPQGLLLYGEVGTGKSLLVDLLADCLPNRKKRRWHFNTFMLETFARLEQLRKSRKANLSAVPRSGSQDEEHSLLWLARDMISTSPILFLDEFQLPDRAASKILSKLFTSFFHLGGVLIATSNRMPEELANASGMEFAAPPFSRLGFLGNRWGLLGSGNQGGRSEHMFAGKGDFAAFLEVLRARCEVWDMEGGKDWRRREAEEDPYTDRKIDEANLRSKVEGFEGLEPLASGNWGLGYEQSLHIKDSSEEISLNEKGFTVATPKHYFVKPSAKVFQEHFVPALESAWKASELHAIQSPAVSPNDGFAIPWKSATLRVYGRDFLVPRNHSGVTKWTFDELCGTNLGPADYITLASTFHTLILTDIPILTLLQKNEARRFITILDALYEARCKLLISAEAGPDDIFFPETKHPPQDRVSTLSSGDEIYPETFSEIFQDQTSPFRPNTSSYTPSASPPSYSSIPSPSSTSQASTSRSILADEDSDFGPVYGAGRSHGPSDGAPGAGNEIGRQFPDFTRTGTFTGEDERFAYKRARSRLWEMCGKKWWARDEEGWWRPLGKDVRRWEGAREDTGSPAPAQEVPEAQEGVSEEELFRHSASPFRTSQESPPKFGWEHAWGLIKWGKKAGAWGKGVEGLKERGQPEVLEKGKGNER